MSIAEVPNAPASPWQGAYVERLIRSLRRDCLDHVIVLGEKHLRRILKSYRDSYHRSRTHLALGKDAPEPRVVQPPELGVWWNWRRSAVSIIDTSGERHSRCVRFRRYLTLRLAVASLKKIWQANQPIRHYVEKITSADFILEIEPKGH